METAVKTFVDNNDCISNMPAERLLELMNHVLSNNVFHFDGHFYKQKLGTAMGTPMAPTVACLFMGWLEAQLLDNSPFPIKHELWKRFIDDIFLLWSRSTDELHQFLEFLNQFHPTIKFTMNYSEVSLPFLDIFIHLKRGYLYTDLYSKPTDARTYLAHSSCHPYHTIKNIPYAQFLRLRRLCSDMPTFQSRCQDMERDFLQRGYSPVSIQEAKTKASRVPRHETLSYKMEDRHRNRVPFIITHNPFNPPFRSWFAELQPLLHTSQKMRKAMPFPPILAERKSRSLRNLLMPSTLPIPDDIDAGCFKCAAEHCVICENHLVESRTFNSMQTGETFTIRHRLSCDSSNVVYMLYCTNCQSTQYMGETMLTLKDRFYLHRSNIKLNKGACVHVNNHFNLPDHSLKNMRCIVVEKVHSLNKTARQRREDFWKNKLKTVFPLGLNGLDSDGH